ncbi:helix-turn-helix transcriptional regulator [Chelatococcus sp. XZ-Ab1]|uniref:helix-turn-helix domain-containing protein n=1 Tax=Chelatococcus sp. XZ-Ab1 TaxID=3034027 RepID=UPI0023E42319|nr:helix-turn-helix transcriptional regulator [Chelatococcus sp. XZ-Ab1]
MDVRAIVGQNVKRLRRGAGLSQEALASAAGFSRAYLSGLEAGRRNPTIMSLWKLSTVLGVPVEELIRGTGYSSAASRNA